MLLKLPLWMHLSPAGMPKCTMILRRPYALVHYYFKDKTISGWGGPEKGWIKMKGQDWRPYSPDAFLCPAFPSYVSGHSTISGACSEILRLYTEDDHFGIEVKRIPGELTEPDNLGEPVYLKFPTFTETADMAGISTCDGWLSYSG